MNSTPWWKKSVIYQVYPRSFCDTNGDGVGDLQGIISHLDHIEKLGADVIWLNPIYASPNDDNGYDISDYRAIMPEFGTMEDFDQLLAEAHRRGIRIVMDLVVNHTSDEHAWFVESRKSKDNPYRDYYIWREGKDGNPPNNWGSAFAGPAWENTDETGEYYLHLFSRKQVDLNWENPAVRKEVYDIMHFWLDKGVDGFRMDVINYISKAPGLPDGPVNGLYGDFVPHSVNGPRIHEFMQEMYREVLSHYDVMSVGETPSVSVQDAQDFSDPARHELNMVFQFEHMGLDEDEVYGKWSTRPLPLPALKENLSRWQTSLHGKAWNSLYWNNHDQPRIVSRIGNDTTDELRVASAKMLGTLLHMMQGTPYIYQGEELGMTNMHFPSISDYRDIDTLNTYREMTEQRGLTHEDMMARIHRHSRDNARTPMQWTDGPNAGFTGGTPWLGVNPNHTSINAAAQVDDPDSVFSHYRKLIALRKELDIITHGDYTLLLPDHPAIFAYERRWNGQRLTVICSFSEHDLTDASILPLCTGELLLSNYAPADTTAHLRPYEARVYLTAE